MTSFQFASVAAACLSGINTILIWQIIKHHNGQVAKLMAALLHTAGETKAASVVSLPDAPVARGAADDVPRHMKPRQIGLSAQ